MHSHMDNFIFSIPLHKTPHPVRVRSLTAHNRTISWLHRTSGIYSYIFGDVVPRDPRITQWFSRPALPDCF
jgi:hypothetical protein